MEYIFHFDHDYKSDEKVEVYLQEHNFPPFFDFEGRGVPGWHEGIVSGESADGINVTVPSFEDVSILFRVGLNALRKVSPSPELNICNEILCPYSSLNGCRRYVASTQCHLLYPGEPGVPRSGISRQHEYWLFTDGTVPVDIERLRQENIVYLDQDEHTQNLIKRGWEPFNFDIRTLRSRQDENA